MFVRCARKCEFRPRPDSPPRISTASWLFTRPLLTEQTPTDFSRQVHPSIANRSLLFGLLVHVRSGVPSDPATTSGIPVQFRFRFHLPVPSSFSSSVVSRSEDQKIRRSERQNIRRSEHQSIRTSEHQSIIGRLSVVFVRYLSYSHNHGLRPGLGRGLGRGNPLLRCSRRRHRSLFAPPAPRPARGRPDGARL